MLERRLAFHYSFLFMSYQTPSAADQAEAHKVVNTTQGNMTPWKGCVTGLAHFSGKFWGHQKNENTWALDTWEHYWVSDPWQGI